MQKIGHYSLHALLGQNVICYRAIQLQISITSCLVVIMILLKFKAKILFLFWESQLKIEENWSSKKNSNFWQTNWIFFTLEFAKRWIITRQWNKLWFVIWRVTKVRWSEVRPLWILGEKNLWWIKLFGLLMWLMYIYNIPVKLLLFLLCCYIILYK